MFDSEKRLLFQQNLGSHSVRIEETTGQLYEVLVYTPKDRFVFGLCDKYDSAEKMANRISIGLNRGRTIKYEPSR